MERLRTGAAHYATGQMTEVRLKDVAALAGVSTATVARVIHNNGYVSAQARERVEQALRESGYRMNVVARELRRQRTVTLGLMLHGTLAHPFVAEVAVGAAQAAADAGFNVLFFDARADADVERTCVEALLERRVDGIVFTTAIDARNVRLALDAGVSVVEIERRLCDEAASVVVDNHAGARQALDHLRELGHRRVAYIGEAFPEPPRDESAVEIPYARYRAYCDAMRELGTPLERYVVAGPYRREPGGWGSHGTGAEQMARLLDQAPDLTAVFAASDLLAAGALQTLYRRGIRVPRDISIVGFDDTFAPHLAPPLTTVRQPMFEMGFRAASLAIARLDGGGSRRDVSTPPVEHCETELIVRASTGPA
jgi:DNA-binding LacI/PurR family transcriptional regulator